MATKNIVGSQADGDFFHACELQNLVRATNGCGVVGHSISASITGVDRVLTLPAFDYVAPDGSGGHADVSYAGGTVTASDVSANSNPQNDALVGDADGNITFRDGPATAETGDVEDAPMVTLASDEILLGKLRREPGTTVIRASDFSPRALDVSQNSSPLTVSATEPSGVSVGHLWVDISDPANPVLNIASEV